MTEATADPKAIEKRTQARDSAIELTEGGIKFQTLNDLVRLSEFVHASGLAPDGFKTVAQIVVAFQHGLEIGLKPMQSLQSLAVINGRPSVWGDATLALIKRHPEYEDVNEWIEGSEVKELVAFCEFKRRGETPTKRSFSWNDAILAKLTNKDTYKSYPKRMLQMRARAWAARDAFPDALKGLSVAEEAQDMPARKVDSVTVSQGEQIPFDPTMTKSEVLTEALKDGNRAPATVDVPLPDPDAVAKAEWIREIKAFRAKFEARPESFYDCLHQVCPTLEALDGLTAKKLAGLVDALEQALEAKG